MKICYKCGAHAEVNPCPACRRNQDLELSQKRRTKDEYDRQRRLAENAIETQRRLAENAIEAQQRISKTETNERRRIATATAVSALSQRLLDIVISQRIAPEHAVEDARILMSSPDFKMHFSEIWKVVALHACLRQAYFEPVLASLLKGGCPDDLVNHIREHPFLRDPALRWLREEAGDNWRRVGVSAYERVLIAIDQLDQEEARVLNEQQREWERAERQQQVKKHWLRVFGWVKDAVVIVGILWMIIWAWKRSGFSLQGSPQTARASISGHQTDGADTSISRDRRPIEIRKARPVEREPSLLKPFGGTQPPPSYAVSGLKLNDSLNVRTGPGAKHPVVATLFNGDQGIQIFGEPVQNGETLWVPVRFRDVAGWVNRQFLVAEVL